MGESPKVSRDMAHHPLKVDKELSKTCSSLQVKKQRKMVRGGFLAHKAN